MNLSLVITILKQLLNKDAWQQMVIAQEAVLPVRYTTAKLFAIIIVA